MTAENYQQLEGERVQRQECDLNIVSSKIFTSLAVSALTYWLVFASLAILDFTGYNQNCISSATFFQSLPNVVMIIPILCTDIDTRKLCYLYTSIIVSVLTNVLEFFVINSESWHNENIKIGCDNMTEFIKGIGGSIMAILSYIILNSRSRETVIFD